MLTRYVLLVGQILVVLFIVEHNFPGILLMSALSPPNFYQIHRTPFRVYNEPEAQLSSWAQVKKLIENGHDMPFGVLLKAISTRCLALDTIIAGPAESAGRTPPEALNLGSSLDARGTILAALCAELDSAPTNGDADSLPEKYAASIYAEIKDSTDIQGEFAFPRTMLSRQWIDPPSVIPAVGWCVCSLF